MEKNIGESDRVFRFAAGLAVIIIGIVAKSWWGIIGHRADHHCLHQSLSGLPALWDQYLQTG